MFKIINFSKDEAKAKADAELVTKALITFAVAVNIKEFILMWSEDSMKIIIDHDGDNISGICCFRHGLNVFAMDSTATIVVLESSGDREELFEFACVVAQAMNCDRMGVTLKTPLQCAEVSGYYQERSL